MSKHGMEVNADLLTAGANRCLDAAGMARVGAKELDANSPSAGIFGDFAEAHDFHEAVSVAHQRHVEQLDEHHRALTGVGENGHDAAGKFTSSDASSADSLHAAEAGFELS